MDVVLRDDDRIEQERRNDLHAVVIGLGVVDLDLDALDDLVDHLGDAITESAGVLPDGHGLLASDDVLDVCLVGVLTGQDRPRIGGVAVRVECLRDAECEGVIRGEDGFNLLVGIEGVEASFHF